MLLHCIMISTCIMLFELSIAKSHLLVYVWKKVTCYCEVVNRLHERSSKMAQLKAWRCSLDHAQSFLFNTCSILLGFGKWMISGYNLFHALLNMYQFKVKKNILAHKQWNNQVDRKHVANELISVLFTSMNTIVPLTFILIREWKNAHSFQC